ncbi:hypothetical protein J6590_031492 [Homalodisca vitripennis]|nr:hypothetical protein J6590_031492 [Homalodisca vitripennis]
METQERVNTVQSSGGYQGSRNQLLNGYPEHFLTTRIVTLAGAGRYLRREHFPSCYHNETMDQRWTLLQVK